MRVNTQPNAVDLLRSNLSNVRNLSSAQTTRTPQQAIDNGGSLPTGQNLPSSILLTGSFDSDDIKSDANAPELRLLDSNIPNSKIYIASAALASATPVINLDVVVVPGQHVGGGMSLSDRDITSSPNDPIAMQILIFETTNFFTTNRADIGQSMFGRALTDSEYKLAVGAALNAGNGYTLIGKQMVGLEALGKTTSAQSRQSDVLKAVLRVREGETPKAYLDSKGILTVGIGHKVVPGDNIVLGQTISQAQIDAFYQRDSTSALNSARAQAHSAGFVTSNFVAALASANYQLGNFPATFPKAWAYMKAGNFSAAIPEIRNSLWNQQTPARVDDFVTAVQDLARLYKS